MKKYAGSLSELADMHTLEDKWKMSCYREEDRMKSVKGIDNLAYSASVLEITAACAIFGGSAKASADAPTGKSGKGA